jgi:vancomycin resistance protein YoaR
VPEKSGSLFNYDTLLAQIEQKIRAFDSTPLSAQLEHFTPTITSSDAEKITSALPDFLNKGEVVLNYTEDVSHFKKQWRIAKESYAPWLELARNEEGEVVFTLVKEKVESYLRKEVSPYIDRVPENAVFRMEADKVVEFKASKSGQAVDIEKTVQDLSNIFVGRSSDAVVTNTVQVAVKIIDPEIKTADVNNLGISDVIGVGISTFKDSHTNRIKNIANAVKRLNGTLIKPGEQFSANKSAGPYTSANGFLPEAVIKGNEIKNEIGGGMCQIGTTLFRMAMNSGMDITERRNHSLVVSYYADPVNGNPGTDATLYEPILDLKFLNDTGNYLLLQTDIDYKRQQLTFTLWGKPDGRSGSYTHPIVHRWLGAGAPQEIEVDTLPPGKKKCQSGFQGAVASFTYTRTTTRGEKIDRVFESYYRPLPRICMVGKAEVSPSCPEGQICAEPVLDTSGGVPTTPIVDSVAPPDPAVSSDPIE